MKVTPNKRQFGKYKPGDVFDLPDKVARVLVKVGKLSDASLTYQTRSMQAAPALAAAVEVDANGDAWDAEIHSADKSKTVAGAWRKRSGRRVSE